MSVYIHINIPIRSMLTAFDYGVSFGYSIYCEVIFFPRGTNFRVWNFEKMYFKCEIVIFYRTYCL